MAESSNNNLVLRIIANDFKCFYSSSTIGPILLEVPAAVEKVQK